MPYRDEKDNQPLQGDPRRDHRVYIHATWAAPGTGGGHPKLSGGITVDLKTGNPAPRSFNRPNQVYNLTQSEILSRRSASADAEYATSVILQGPSGSFEIRSQSGNNYDVNDTVSKCDCPDWLRVDNSGYGIVRCKHIYLVFKALADPSFPFGLDWSVRKAAEETGFSERAIQEACEKGFVFATKTHNVWRIPAAEAEPFVAIWRGRIWPFI